MGLVMVALAERAIACKGWRWLPGMRIINAGYRGIERPDLSDPATLGCLVALVREAWVGWMVDAEHLAPDVYRVRVHDIDDTAARAFRGPTLGDVLVAALECAP